MIAQKQVNNERKPMTPQQLAEYWGCDRERILRLIATKQLNAVNIGAGPGKARYMIRPTDLEEFERRRSTATAPELPKPRRKTKRALASAARYYPE
jgi:hypothetical protein